MYCHEGMWQKVDRIWIIHTDGTHNTLIHKRTMAMEIAGHEFWGLDGKTIWYDWQYPKGEDFFLASYNLETGKRTAYHMQRNEWSIHFNLTKDLDLFTGDGGDSGQVAQAPDGEWIELFYPHMIPQGEGALNGPDFWQPGVFKSEHLVNMAHHNYRAEPNVRFTPDKKYVFFTSNMFGPSYIFGVEVKKAVNPSGSRRPIHARPSHEVQPSRADPDHDREMKKTGNFARANTRQVTKSLLLASKGLASETWLVAAPPSLQYWIAMYKGSMRRHLLRFRHAPLRSALHVAAPPAPPRQIQQLNTDWRFLQSDAPGAESPTFDDSAWKPVTLPHDWSIAGPVRRKRPQPRRRRLLPHRHRLVPPHPHTSKTRPRQAHLHRL